MFYKKCLSLYMQFSKPNLTKFFKTDHKYQIFNMKYTTSEITCLNNFSLGNENKTFSFYGNIHKLFLKDFLSIIGQNKDINIIIINKLIMKLVEKVTKSYGTYYAWVTIRISMPNNIFNTPRWHKDGYYFSDLTKPQRKFLVVLKGPGTLILEDNDGKLDKEMEKENTEISKDPKFPSREVFEKMRKNLADLFKKQPQVQLKKYQSLIFTSGKKGLIHSEPKITRKRFFISILPGPKEGIKEWATRGKEEFVD